MKKDVPRIDMQPDVDRYEHPQKAAEAQNFLVNYFNRLSSEKPPSHKDQAATDQPLWITRIFAGLFALLFITACFVGCKNQRKEAESILQNFHYFEIGTIPKTITDDYHEYVESLPSEERRYVAEFNINGYHNESGEHAITIRIPLDGVWNVHLLIYGKDNRRTKTIKYDGGHYAS